MLQLSFVLLLAACASGGGSGVPQPEKAADSHAGAGLYLIGVGRFSEARERLERALELDPQHPQATAGMGLVAEGVGDLDRAVEYHRAAVGLVEEAGSDQGRGPILNNLGRVLCRLDQVDEALQELESAAGITGYPSRHVPLTNAARCALGAGRLEEAGEFVDSALAHVQEFAPALLVRAELRFEQERFAAAAEDLDRVRELDRSPRSLYFSARVAEELGQSEAAEAFSDELSERFPQSDYVGRLKANEGGTP
nr:tetratricopeptide repeat protein [Halorhodospira halochloris]